MQYVKILISQRDETGNTETIQYTKHLSLFLYFLTEQLFLKVRTGQLTELVSVTVSARFAVFELFDIHKKGNARKTCMKLREHANP